MTAFKFRIIEGREISKVGASHLEKPEARSCLELTNGRTVQGDRARKGGQPTP